MEFKIYNLENNLDSDKPYTTVTLTFSGWFFKRTFYFTIYYLTDNIKTLGLEIKPFQVIADIVNHFNSPIFDIRNITSGQMGGITYIIHYNKI